MYNKTLDQCGEFYKISQKSMSRYRSQIEWLGGTVTKNLIYRKVKGQRQLISWVIFFSVNR